MPASDCSRLAACVSSARDRLSLLLFQASAAVVTFHARYSDTALLVAQRQTQPLPHPYARIAIIHYTLQSIPIPRVLLPLTVVTLTLVTPLATSVGRHSIHPCSAAAAARTALTLVTGLQTLSCSLHRMSSNRDRRTGDSSGAESEGWDGGVCGGRVCSVCADLYAVHNLTVVSLSPVFTFSLHPTFSIAIYRNSDRSVATLWF